MVGQLGGGDIWYGSHVYFKILLQTPYKLHKFKIIVLLINFWNINSQAIN